MPSSDRVGRPVRHAVVHVQALFDVDVFRLGICTHPDVGRGVDVRTYDDEIKELLWALIPVAFLSGK